MRKKEKHDELVDEKMGAERSSSVVEGAQPPAEGANGEGEDELEVLIAQRAYEIYQERGGVNGEDIDDWLRAEAEVRSQLGASEWKTTETERRGRHAAS